MKYSVLSFMFFILPSFVQGQIEWVENQIYPNSNFRFIATENKEVVFQGNRSGLQHIKAINKSGEEVFYRNNFDIDFNCSIGEINPMQGAAIFYSQGCSAVNDPWGHTHFATFIHEANWDTYPTVGYVGDEAMSAGDSCYVNYARGYKFCTGYCWWEGNNHFIDFNLSNDVNDVATISSEVLIFATEGGIEVRNVDGVLDSIYEDIIFDQIALNAQQQLIGLQNDSLSLLSPEFELLAKSSMPTDILDWAVDSQHVAILTEGLLVYLYDNDLELMNSFQIAEESEFQFITFSDSTLLLAGNERYGSPEANKGSNSPFIKEYFYDGHTEDFGQDASILNTTYELVPGTTNDGFYRVHMQDLQITVLNNGDQTLEKVIVRTAFPPVDPSVSNKWKYRGNSFDNLGLEPGEQTTLSWPDLYAFFKENPAGMDLDICFWTSHPNNQLDRNSSNDFFCLNDVVDTEESAAVNNFVIFPNPADNVLNIDLGNTPLAHHHLEIKVLTPMGQTVERLHVDGNQTAFKVPLNNLPNGLYILEVTTVEQMSAAKRFIVFR